MSHQDDVFVRTIFGVMIGLAVFAVVIFILANSLGGSEPYKPQGAAANGNKMAQAQIAKELKPVGQVDVAGAASGGGGAGGGLSGEAIVNKTCGACHVSGVAGAPKIGDKAEWEKRLKVGGLPNLLKVAIHGLGAMPPRGGGGYKDDEMKAAIVYMLHKTGIEVAGGGGGEAKAAGGGSSGGPWKVDLAKGKELVGKVCAACHVSGVAGAPKIGDHDAWAKRYKAGKAEVLKIAETGKGAMPPRGGSSYNDQEMKDAIGYMLHESGIDVTK